MKNKQIVRKQLNELLIGNIGHWMQEDDTLYKHLDVGENKDTMKLCEIKQFFGAEYIFNDIRIEFNISVGQEYTSHDPDSEEKQPCILVASVDEIYIDGELLDDPKLYKDLSSELWSVCELGGVFNV